MERAAHPGFWQSVTGSLDFPDEPLLTTARREVLEETGIDTSRGELSDWNITNTYEILAEWRHRYAPGVLSNTEHVFGFELPRRTTVKISPREHSASRWMPWREAAEACFSWSNRDAILMLGDRVGKGSLR